MTDIISIWLAYRLGAK